MPTNCDCATRTRPVHPHVTHGVPRLNATHSGHVVRMIRNLTTYDQFVFEYATRRALDDIWLVQNLTGRALVCPPVP